jgi:hypothetical protein
MPKFRDAKTEEYEFPADGNWVRENRWKNEIISIASLVGFNVLEFEIANAIAAAEQLTEIEK